MLNYDHNDCFYVYYALHDIQHATHSSTDKCASMMMLCSALWEDLCEIQLAGVYCTEMHCMGCQHVTACDIRILAYQTRFYMACACWMLLLHSSVQPAGLARGRLLPVMPLPFSSSSASSLSSVYCSSCVSCVAYLSLSAACR